MHRALGYQVIAIMSLPILLLGCGPEVPERQPRPFVETRTYDGVKGPSDCRAPSAEYYLHLLQAPPPSFHLQDTTQILWVNFEGATVDRGIGRDRSFIVCGSSAQLPAPNVSTDVQQDILEAVRSQYAKSRVKIEVTLDRPSGGDYTTVHVTNSLADLGCVNEPGVAGVAPYDPGNLNPNDIGFAFAGSFSSSVHGISTVVAHEAAHSFGLAHINNRKAIMYPAYSPGVAGFGSGQVYDKRDRFQDSPKLLRDTLGEAEQLPEAEEDPPTVQEDDAEESTDENPVEDLWEDTRHEDEIEVEPETATKDSSKVYDDLEETASHGECGDSYEGIADADDRHEAACSILAKMVRRGELDSLPPECSED